MKSKWLLAFAFILFSAGAVPAQTPPAADPETAILGRWKGTGMAFLIEMIFTSDHVVYMADTPSEKGKWEYQNGEYLMGEGPGRTTAKATIGPDGQMVFFPVDEPEFKTILRKIGAPAPAAAPAASPPLASAPAAATPAATPAPPPKLPEGEWRFAYINRSSIQAGPPFDSVTFTGDTMHLKFTWAGEEFDVKCLMAGNLIAFRTNDPPKLTELMNFLPLGYMPSDSARLSFRWEDDGNTLILSNMQAAQPFNCEWAFLRPDAFRPNQVAGTWTGKGSLTGNTMQMADDGTLAYTSAMYDRPDAPAQPLLPKQYYRLWKSQFGDAISIAQLVPDMHMVNVQMSRIELVGNDIILTPIESEQGDVLRLMEDKKANWKLNATAEDAAAKGPAKPLLTPFDLAGDWTATAPRGAFDFHFIPDGSAELRSSQREVQELAPDGAKCQFRLVSGTPFQQLKFIRFENPEHDRLARLRGIIEAIDADSFRMEFIQGAIPTEFSIQAVVFRRKGPKPQYSAGELAEFAAAAVPPAVPSYKVQQLPSKQIDLPGGVKLEVVRIPAGSFMMGMAAGQKEEFNSEPAHRVSIDRDFYIGRTEVTQAQWIALMGKWPLDTPESPDGPPRRASDQAFVPRVVGGDYPAHYLSWTDCQAFVAALNAHIVKTGQGPALFRLPAEAEWEYACRAGTQTRFYWGDDLNLSAIDHYAWNCNNPFAEENRYSPGPVGLKLPNRWGLFDMSGNVAEWCRDSDTVAVAPPRPGTVPAPPQFIKGQYIQRGGATDNSETSLTSSRRYGTLDYRNTGNGMRLAGDIPAP